MSAITCHERDLIARDITTETTIRMGTGPTTPLLARQHVRSGLPADMSAGRMCDLVLLTSELVTNAVEYSDAGSLDLTVVRGRTFIRIEVSNPDESWARAPEPNSPEPDQIGGWGLFLVEHLSDRWGTSDADCTVWFEVDHTASPFSAGFPISSDSRSWIAGSELETSLPSGKVTITSSTSPRPGGPVRAPSAATARAPSEFNRPAPQCRAPGRRHPAKLGLCGCAEAAAYAVREQPAKPGEIGTAVFERLARTP
jgi:anti-sigma regulatory factor (Ser/Thr protein kinase)